MSDSADAQQLFAHLSTLRNIGCLLLLFVAVVNAQAPQGTVTVTDGKDFPAALVDIDESWQTVWKTNDQVRRLDASGLVVWGRSGQQPTGPIIVLAGNTLLHGEITRLGASEITVRSAVFGDVVLARRMVRGIIWRPSLNVLEYDRLLTQLASSTRAQDVIWTVNGDELEGSVGSVDRPPRESIAQLAVTTRGSSTPIVANMENVVAVGFRSSSAAVQTQKEKPYGVMTLRSGDVLWSQSVQSESDPANVTLLDGTLLSAPREQLISQIEAIQMFHDRVTYVSNLPNRMYKHIPFLSLAWGYGIDRNVSGGLLRSDGNVYWKGIGMHSVARLSCELDAPYKRLESEIAIDDSTDGRGSVIFRVYAERAAAGTSKPTWQVLYESPIVRGGERPRPIAVDIENSTRIALVVDAADRGDEGDHANWLNVRLIR